jgi:hypothetical protein
MVAALVQGSRAIAAKLLAESGHPGAGCRPACSTELLAPCSGQICAGQRPVEGRPDRSGEGSVSLMNDLSVLTPPFLVAAVVIIAIVAFLRHEMGRGRVDRADPDDNSAPDADHEQDS